jgi:hypothetical protein
MYKLEPNESAELSVSGEKIFFTPEQPPRKDAERVVDEFLAERKATAMQYLNRDDLIQLAKRAIIQVGCCWPQCADFYNETKPVDGS